MTAPCIAAVAADLKWPATMPHDHSHVERASQRPPARRGDRAESAADGRGGGCRIGGRQLGAAGRRAAQLQRLRLARDRAGGPADWPAAVRPPPHVWLPPCGNYRALINLTILVVIGLYLVYEAIDRFFEPQQIDGWIVVDRGGGRAGGRYRHGGAAVCHVARQLESAGRLPAQLGRRISSVGVILAGAVILLVGHLLGRRGRDARDCRIHPWQSLAMMARSIHILMEGARPTSTASALVAACNRSRA